ncbi:hypothetical protein [Lichenibacterium dinghuense]|uniref:hypothetical protein n=1 Tax=Lichenibacterium dinghuense TaxID=2895977 RepID=UPI001F481A60|nr:hypothetical protein [Lichenibacterium sp. 6Y81]
MPIRHAAFRQADLVRALKAADKAGLKVQRFEIDPDGRIAVVTGEPGKDQPISALEAWKAKRASKLKGWDDVVDGSWRAGNLSLPARTPKR